MPVSRPLATPDVHEVFNQTPALDVGNWFTSDRALTEAVRRAGGAQHERRLSRLGRRAASAEVVEWGILANRHVPTLENYDSQGRRIDEVAFHPAYHQLMGLGLGNGIAAAAWDGTPHGHVLHAAMSYLLGQVDAGTICPMTMTYAAVPVLRRESAVSEEWLPRILAARYDPASRPAADKASVTIGMTMTEKQGGSDLRANTTRAEPVDRARRTFSLTGHKWFCSAPMSDAFLTLAQTERGLSCFLVPRWLPDGRRNTGFRIVRLKDKLGDRSNATAEIEYDRAFSWRIGEEGRGIATILEAVQHTRLDCVVGSAAGMRGALVQALWHTQHRQCFGRRLADHPAMAAVLADLAVESEAATALAVRIAAALDAGDPLTRLLTPVAKYWICKRLPGFAAEAMECLGGNGYVETSPMPRHFRQSPVNAIWEGSGNIVALDVLRVLQREPEAVEALRAFLAEPIGREANYDQWLNCIDLDCCEEARARELVERLALAAQAAILLLAQSPLAPVFCRSRLGAMGFTYGAAPGLTDARAVIERAMPKCSAPGQGDA
ncbi:acyl-CoA dehydrogenase [Novosphingobium indicum]|uniref:Acyl-CoA dehydrogenase n=1 Tax=Novosphingobium indicum TaxID=462949 RepID=A0ABQ2JGK1_9SPHN|nr:acyl-CoA dehydrogenase family protein [Novosphingobium indicum]GGN46021.1 acyl-CoA dehydrogenase [Novosphingobium indicum]